MLIDNLPPDARTVLKASGPAAEWSTTDYLIAQVVDELRLSNHMFNIANFKHDKRPEAPKPVERPYKQPEEQAPEKRFATTSELAAFVKNVNDAL